jgi:recombination protein RecA
MNEGLVKALANIEKNFGKGSVISFEEGHDNTIKRVSTGSLGLDLAIGGGYPYGRIIEIYGPESSGKSSCCLHAVAEVQANGGIAAYIDTEHSFSPDYAQNLGIDLSKENFIFAQPDSGEQALSIVEELVKSKEISMIIVDSVAALTPQAELDGDFGESKMGLHARLMSQAMRKLVGIVNNSDCIVIFVNQLRDKIGCNDKNNTICWRKVVSN